MNQLVKVTRDIEEPPGGWHFTVEQTGLKIKAASAKLLGRKVRQHLEANSLPVPDPWQEWFEDALCRQMNIGHPFCGQTIRESKKNPKHLSLHLVERFIRSVAGVLRGRQLVSQEEAERRAEICVNCPLNTTIGGCKGCYAITEPLKKLLKGRTTKAAPDYCSACGCVLSLKVYCPNDVLDRAEASSGIEYPPHCWRHGNAPSDESEGAE